MSEVSTGGVDELRIPFEKIKMGKKLEVEGYGTLFQGEFDHQTVALKKLNVTNLANIKPTLLAEILTISRFRHHPNLVALLGFCDDKSSNEIILVYEYVGAGNLADKMRSRLTTIQRLEICLGAARGLDYLHTGTAGIAVVHGNIKLSKILLKYYSDDDDSSSSSRRRRYEAKVSSFGLSKIVPGGGRALESFDSFSSDAAAAGGGGKKLQVPDDVYAFGVVLLEVMCGVSELVDTDDYQERHVTELIPKKMKQNKLQKMVHLDIRKEFKLESLETYAKIACQCVVEDPEARPKMAQVVEELEKALRLQGGEVTYVQIPPHNNIIAEATTVVDVDKEDGTLMESAGNQPADDVIDYKDVVVNNINPPTAAEEEEEEDVTTVESNNRHEEEEEEEGIIHLDTVLESASNGGPADNINTTQVLFQQQEEEKDTSSSIDHHVPMDAHDKQINTTDEQTTEETIDDLDSDKISNDIVEENKQNDQSIKTATESTNHDTSTASTNQKEGQDSRMILKSDRGTFINELNHEDELEHLRIPFEKIKFGKKIDVRGYGSVFEGEFNHQQVALKRLNITNLGNIKPKLLSAILTVSRFRQHPNLVALIGLCDENNKEIILVYEYVSGGNLADKMSKHLTTIQRLKICLGAARGLEYLHSGLDSVYSNLSVIDSDIKLSKILLKSDSVSSGEFEAKVSGFGLPKLLPGHVEIGRKSMDLVKDAASGKLTKESDVYSFGVLLLEVLCGVPELVDTDDYQERHVTELVPKRLEQNMLRKIVHFDIRGEITAESLDTYAKIACRCVLKTPEERPVMSVVVEELEKALRLQGGKVSDVNIFYSSSNGNGLAKVPIGEDDHEGDDNGETMSLNITTEEKSKLGQSSPVPILGSNNNENVPEDAEKNNDDDNINVLESAEEVTVDQMLNEESKIIEENEAKLEVPVDEDGQEDDDNGETMSLNKTESKVTEEPTEAISQEDVEKANGDDINIPEHKEETVVDLNPIVESKINGENEVNNEREITTSSSDSAMQKDGFPLLDERSDHEDATKAEDDVLMMKTQNPHMEEIMEAQQNFEILDDDAKAGFLSTEEPELIVNIKGGFSNSPTQTQEPKSKRSSSTCSESSNGDDTAPSDYLLPKSPENLKIRSYSSGNCSCCCCCCSWWQFISDKVVLYGGQLWDKLISCFTWITGQCSSKKD